MKKLIVFSMLTSVVPAVLATPIRIMPLGDSITWGAPVAGGYRLPLYNLLTQAGYEVDYVGTLKENPSSDLPDPDHEGHSGWVSSDPSGTHSFGGLYQNLGSWLAQVDVPDVILVHAGTNDGNDASVERLKAIATRLHALTPTTHIIMTTILGHPTANNQFMDRHLAVNAGIRSMVDELAAKGWPVHYLDMYSALDYTVPEGKQHPDDLSDGLHPSAQGYAKMANAWFGAITDIFGNDGSSFVSTAQKRSFGYEACGVPASETGDYRPIYAFDISASMNLSTEAACKAIYQLDRSGSFAYPFDRIAYFLELYAGDSVQYAWVSADAFTTDLKEIGLPTLFNKVVHQLYLSNMNVYSNVQGIETGKGITTGNIEFWPYNYSGRSDVPNCTDAFDFGDACQLNNGNFGSMQIHNYGARQTIIGLSNLCKGGSKLGPCLGIGNSPSGTDWTTIYNADTYDYARMTVLVRPSQDTVAPTMTGAFLAAADGKTVNVTFDESVIVSGLSGVYFSAGGIGALDAQVLPDHRTVAVTFAAPVAAGTVLSAAGVSDYFGNAMELATLPVAQGAGVPDEVASLVGDAADDYTLVAKINVPDTGNFNSDSDDSVNYEVADLNTTDIEFDRVAYCLVLKKDQTTQYVWTAFDTMTVNPKALGVPVAAKGYAFQQKVNNLVVKSNVDGVTEGTFDDGNIEFWAASYNSPVSLGGLDGSGSLFDFDDTPESPLTRQGYGSMQVHNYSEKQTLWAINNWGNDNKGLCIGIGNSTGDSRSTDWTFLENSAKSWTTRTLYVFVRPGKPNRAGLSTRDQTDYDKKYPMESCLGQVEKTVPAEDLAGFELMVATDLPDKFNVKDASWREENLYGLMDRREDFKKALRDGDIARVGYYMLLQKPNADPVWIWTAMDPFTQDIDRLVIPEGGYYFQQDISNLSVRSNSDAVTPGDFGTGGFIEFTSSSYNDGGDGKFDWRDGGFSNEIGGHGAMQIHNAAREEVLWSITKLSKVNQQIGIGIGNNPNSPSYDIDYTFVENGSSYSVRRLFIFVKPVDGVTIPGEDDPGETEPVAIAKAQAVSDGRTIAVRLNSEFTFNAQYRVTATCDGVAVASVRPLGKNGLLLTTSAGMGEGTVHEVMLHGVETLAGTAAELTTSVTIPPPFENAPEFLSGIPEASDYRLVQVLDQNFGSNVESLITPAYDLDESLVVSDFDRVAYAMELVTAGERPESRWVWVSMAAFTDDAQLLGLPYHGSGIFWQQTVSDMTVDCSDTVTNITKGEHLNGNLEFWCTSYGGNPGLPGIGGTGNYDWNDTVEGYGKFDAGYGCMQVHNYERGETLLAISHFGGGETSRVLDVGIGNAEGNKPDWTQLGNANQFSARRLCVLVRPRKVTEPFGEPLEFAIEPLGRKVKSSSHVLLVAIADGATAYQWYKDGVAIAGATGSAFELAFAKVSDSGVYKVLAIGPNGASFCTPASLTVTPSGLSLVVR